MNNDAKALVQNEVLVLLDEIIDENIKAMQSSYNIATIAREVVYSTRHYAEALGSILHTINTQKLTGNKLETIADIATNALKGENHV